MYCHVFFGSQCTVYTKAVASGLECYISLGAVLSFFIMRIKMSKISTRQVVSLAIRYAYCCRSVRSKTSGSHIGRSTMHTMFRGSSATDAFRGRVVMTTLIISWKIINDASNDWTNEDKDFTYNPQGFTR